MDALCKNKTECDTKVISRGKIKFNLIRYFATQELSGMSVKTLPRGIWFFCGVLQSSQQKQWTHIFARCSWEWGWSWKWTCKPTKSRVCRRWQCSIISRRSKKAHFSLKIRSFIINIINITCNKHVFYNLFKQTGDFVN